MIENKKIILVSPAKSGTHFLISIFKNLGLENKGKLNICSDENGFYSLTNSYHTSFNKFFYELDKDSPYGGRLIPLNNFLGIVNCRHPADIFFSPIYLLTRVEHAIPTPIAGIKEACIIVNTTWVVANSTIPIIPTIFINMVQPKAIIASCKPIGAAS